jgi:hypothetical protein
VQLPYEVGQANGVEKKETERKIVFFYAFLLEIWLYKLNAYRK